MSSTSNPFRNSVFRNEPEIPQYVIDQTLHSMGFWGTLFYSLKEALVGFGKHFPQPIAWALVILAFLYCLFLLFSHFLSENPDIKKISIGKSGLNIERADGYTKIKKNNNK